MAFFVGLDILPQAAVRQQAPMVPSTVAIPGLAVPGLMAPGNVDPWFAR